MRRWWVPDVVDYHVYGGGLLIAAGLGWAFGWWLAPVAIGVLLVGIGLVKG